MLDEIQNTFDLDKQEKEAQRVLQELPDEEEKIDLKLLQQSPKEVYKTVQKQYNEEIE